ncbi:uncharacterized protein L3040_000575 [Drepanopeziza brunnea f. sp. 'multigermtubi']|uniref:uncharacterized protein n=1 Tax=Drepanopeziza brunnea f. sp. 'multigermtubi' TaxID=698441 RepID=UPI002384FA8F|nr:hypothetical protein L3040_000575 [Drepanopeziza brunnea f. sp. 'multigermtubi']
METFTDQQVDTFMADVDDYPQEEDCAQMDASTSSYRKPATPDHVSTSSKESISAHRDFPIQQFYTYKHFGCKHDYHPAHHAQVSGGVELSEPERNIRAAFEPSTLYVINPRWCKFDLGLREQSYNSAATLRCEKIDQYGKSADAKGKLKQYVRGIAAGRIAALTMSLDECAAVARDPFADELMTSMEGFTIRADEDTIRADEDADKLADMMSAMANIIDELEQDFMLAFREQESYEKGYRDGLAYQALMETESFAAPTMKIQKLVPRAW